MHNIFFKCDTTAIISVLLFILFITGKTKSTAKLSSSTEVEVFDER